MTDDPSLGMSAGRSRAPAVRILLLPRPDATPDPGYGANVVGKTRAVTLNTFLAASMSAGAAAGRARRLMSAAGGSQVQPASRSPLRRAPRQRARASGTVASALTGKAAMRTINPPDRRGFALVSTLLIILVVSILALGVAWLGSSERKTSFAEGVHIRSVLAADAGSEAGINFLRFADIPPALSSADGVVAGTERISLVNSQAFEFQCVFVGKSFRPGWGVEFPDFDYHIQSTGYASTKGEGHVEVLASRMFKTGY